MGRRRSRRRKDGKSHTHQSHHSSETLLPSPLALRGSSWTLGGLWGEGDAVTDGGTVTW